MKGLFIGLLILGFSAVSAQGPYTLAPLPYAYNALEPFIDAQTMEIHYSRHHAGYVRNLNTALAGTEAEKWSLTDLMSQISTQSETIRNNGGGHYNHDLFWTILTPEKDTRPSAELEKAIVAHFGTLDSLKTLLNKAAATRFGSGWAWLVVTSEGKLAVGSTPNQDNPLMDNSLFRGIPILGIDVWEHAYYLKYQNKRGDYLQALWSVINWKEVSRRYEAARGKR